MLATPATPNWNVGADLTLVVKAPGVSTSLLVPAIRAMLAQVEPKAIVADVQPMELVVAKSMAQTSFTHAAHAHRRGDRLGLERGRHLRRDRVRRRAAAERDRHSHRAWRAGRRGDAAGRRTIAGDRRRPVSRSASSARSRERDCYGRCCSTSAPAIPLVLAATAVVLLIVAVLASAGPARRAQRSIRSKRCAGSRRRHSARSATSGSTFVARRAGTQLAIPATQSNAAATAANVSGSVGVTPYSTPCITLVSTSAAPIPTTTPSSGEPQPTPDDHPPHGAGSRAERDANADLAGALRDEIGEHAVDPQRSEHESHRAEETEKDGEQSRAGHGVADGVVERERGRERLLRIHGAHRVLEALDHRLRLALRARRPGSP